MEYNEDYSESMNIILDIVETTQPTSFIYKEQFITQLYNDITNGVNYARQLIEKGKLQVHTIHKNFNLPSFSSVFMPTHIQEKIAHNIVSQTIYKGHVNRQPITLKLSIIKGTKLSKTQIHHMAHKVFSWLYVCNKYSTHNCKGSNCIDIYFTDYKKIFPNHSTQKITPDNINSGYSYVCSPENTIVIFRLEEWFKVFVHECMHSYGFQPISHNETVLDTQISSLLPIKGSIKVSEAYVETWARIINAFYSAIYNSENINDFYTIFEFTLHVESIFSTMQLHRVLSFMNISYRHVTTNNIEYKENTNTFAYYVLCGAFMMNPYMFMHWCATNNENLLQFNNTTEGTSSFHAYMLRALNHIPLFPQIDRLSHLTNNTFGLRMTLADV